MASVELRQSFAPMVDDHSQTIYSLTFVQEPSQAKSL
jgi:hypothetical protein